VAEPIIVPSKHKIRVHPLPSGSCRVEIDAVVTWDTTIEVYLAKMMSTEQIHAGRT